jgi:hypothetical protein
MTQSLYAGGLEPPLPAARTSLLAVFALVLGIISLLVCCIPGPGILAVILGVAALLAIGASHDRLTGRGLAVSGLVLGLLTTVLSIGLWVGVAIGLAQVGRYTDVMEAAEKVDRPALSRFLTGSADAALTEADLESFRDAYRQEWGEYREPLRGVAPYMRAYMELTRYDAAMREIQDEYPDARPLPLPVLLRDGTPPVFLVLDNRETTPDGMARVRNVAIPTRDGRSIIWLLDPGAAPPAPSPDPAEVPEEPPGG